MGTAIRFLIVLFFAACSECANHPSAPAMETDHGCAPGGNWNPEKNRCEYPDVKPSVP